MHIQCCVTTHAAFAYDLHESLWMQHVHFSELPMFDAACRRWVLAWRMGRAVFSLLLSGTEMLVCGLSE